MLGATARAIGLVERFATCFTDGRSAKRVVHEVAMLVGQRVFGIAPGYEDLIDHDRLPHDPVLAGADRYHRIAHDGPEIEALFVELFLQGSDAEGDRARARRHRRSAAQPPGGSVLPRLLRLPLRHLLAAKLRRANVDVSAGAVEEVTRIVGRMIRARWPRVRIVLRGDSGFAREPFDGLVRGEPG